MKLDLDRVKDDMARQHRRLQRADALAKAAKALLRANRQVDIWANDEWRSARRAVEDALEQYWEGDDAL